MEFLIPAENDTYVDLNIRLFVRGKLTSTDGKALEETEYTAVTKNLLNSLFSQCSLTLNGTTISQTTDPYQYRSYLETYLTYGSDAANSHLTNGFCYLNTGDLCPATLLRPSLGILVP